MRLISIADSVIETTSIAESPLSLSNTYTHMNIYTHMFVCLQLMTGDAKKGLDNINLFSIITIWSFILMAPIAFAMEGMKLAPSVLAAEGLDPQAMLTKLLLAGLFFHSYQQVCTRR